MTVIREFNRKYLEWEDKDTLTVAEARAILDSVPESALDRMAKINKGLPRAKAMKIFRDCIAGLPDEQPLRSLIAKNIQREFGRP